MDQGQSANVNQNVAELLTKGMREAWKKFMEEFNQVFDMDQLDPVLALLKQLKLNTQNPTKKQQVKEEKTEQDERDNDYNNESTTLEKKVFGNHLLAKSVFKCLPHSDLLSCRVINSYWHDFATEILLKRDYAMRFIRPENSIRYFQQDSEDKVSNWRTLDMLTELLRTCKKFPCNTFVFDGGNLGNDDAQRFFSVHGQFIKTIHVILEDKGIEQDADKSEAGFDVSLTHSRTIGMILSHQLPNLETLDLDLSHEREDEWRGFESLLFPFCEQEIALPNLKTIRYHRVEVHDYSILRQLLNAAVNLKHFFLTLQNFDLVYLNVFIETGKIKTITDATFDVPDDLEEFENMVEHEPEVNFLEVLGLNSVCKEPQTWKRISTVLSKLLKSSQKSLTIFRVCDILGFLPQLQLPILQNLRHVNLKVVKQYEFNPEDVHDYSYSFLPRGATFSRNFPQLNSVDFTFEAEISNNNDDAAAWWSKCFPTDEIVPTVKRLAIRGSAGCPDLWMNKFSLVFPNISCLVVSGTKDFLSFSQSIWKNYQNITDLCVKIDISSPLNIRPFALNSSFTGIPLEMCKILEKFSWSKLEKAGANFVEHPSILSLKDLRVLEIDFNEVNNGQNEEYDFSSILTSVTCVCALERMDNLKKVDISVNDLQGNPHVQSKLKNFLQPFTSFDKVTID